jgi:predicted NBD/HSP70 family sugar kinase
MTIGELKAGAGKGFADMLFLKLDRSISACVSSGGRLHRGSQGFAGMIGHAPTGEDSEIVCRCGARGCLEALASGEAIARDGANAAREGRSRYLAEMLDRNGEINAADVSHGAQLGEALVTLLNPAIVVLGGGVAQSGDILLAAVREAIYRQSHPLVTRDLRIVRSQLGGSAGLVGAAELVCNEVFAPLSMQEWIARGSPRRGPAFVAWLEAETARSRKAARERLPRTAMRAHSATALP